MIRRDIMGAVDEKLCYERHETIKNNQAKIHNELDTLEKRLDAVEDSVAKLSSTIEVILKRNIFDKILIAALAGMVLLFMVLLFGTANIIKLINVLAG
jgi:hypothetical protein